MKQKLLELCWAIEDIKASEQQTKVSVMAADIMKCIEKFEKGLNLISSSNSTAGTTNLIQKLMDDFTKL